MKKTKEIQKRLLACPTPCMPAYFYSIDFVDLQIGGLCRGALRLGLCVYNRTQGEKFGVVRALLAMMGIVCGRQSDVQRR
jgi:hypothetical protein